MDIINMLLDNIGIIALMVCAAVIWTKVRRFKERLGTVSEADKEAFKKRALEKLAQLEADKVVDPVEERKRARRQEGIVAKGALAFLFIGLCLGGGGTYFANEMRSFMEVAVSAQGVVTELIWVSSDDGGAYYPHVDFTTADGQYRGFRSRSGSNPAFYKQGQAVNVLYNPQDPSDAMIDAGWMNWILSGVLMFAGFLFIAGAMRVMKGVNSRRRI